MKKYARYGRVSRQQGVALLFALVVLLVVSVVGVAALRSSSFSAKVAMGSHLDAMTFEAAESAIAEQLSFLEETNAASDSAVFDQIAGLFAGDTLVWCITSSGALIERSCEDGEFMDARGVMLGEARARTIGFSPVSGTQLSFTGSSSTIIGDYELALQGVGSMPDYGLLNRHVQIALRRGMVPSQEIR